MIHVTDTFSDIPQAFPQGKFSMEGWKAYIQRYFGENRSLFEKDLEEYVSSGDYSFERDFLPVLQAVWDNPRLEVLHQHFQAVTDQLNQRLLDRFGREMDVEVVLYLGLCNGAGWAVQLDGKDHVLIGVEKVLELGWETLPAMQGLVYHELGHLYHGQHGRLHQPVNSGPQKFVWQLFTEGVAMCFEQEMVGDPDFFQQDQGGWQDWCREHFPSILEDFDRDLPGMDRFQQRYFGDWVRYQGWGDVGYYLGARFVRQLLSTASFDQVIQLSLEEVCRLYRQFVRSHLHRDSLLPAGEGGTAF